MSLTPLDSPLLPRFKPLPPSPPYHHHHHHLLFYYRRSGSVNSLPQRLRLGRTTTNTSLTHFRYDTYLLCCVMQEKTCNLQPHQNCVDTSYMLVTLLTVYQNACLQHVIIIIVLRNFLQCIRMPACNMLLLLLCLGTSYSVSECLPATCYYYYCA